LQQLVNKECVYFTGWSNKLSLYLSGKDGTMRTIKFSVLIFVCAFLVLINGCGSELENCKLQNRAQQNRLDELEAEVRTTEVNLEQCGRKLDTAESTCDIKQKALQQKIAALEEDLTGKRRLITRMQEQLLGGVALPVELSTMLEDFAKENEMVTYDAGRGIVKFKSDLLFEKGSDKVASTAEQVVKSLCGILNSGRAKEFDVIIAGHTDDIPIGKPATRAKHPTNWHLSAHRAISVLKLMAGSKIDSKRMSVRGFGEHRPVEPNKPNKRGNPKNRRVEIYIVPKGT
jgi:chemotaxis protein MotB